MFISIIYSNIGQPVYLSGSTFFFYVRRSALQSLPISCSSVISQFGSSVHLEPENLLAHYQQTMPSCGKNAHVNFLQSQFESDNPLGSTAPLPFQTNGELVIQKAWCYHLAPASPPHTLLCVEHHWCLRLVSLFQPRTTLWPGLPSSSIQAEKPLKMQGYGGVYLIPQ